MTLRWIGIRDRDSAVFNQAGLGATSQGTKCDPLMRTGSILIETQTRPRTQPVNILRYSSLRPWPSGLKLCLDPNGTLRLSLHQSGKETETTLRTPLGREEHLVHITFTWDAPARRGSLSVYLPDAGRLYQKDVRAPFPLAQQNAKGIMTDPRHSQIDDDVVFLAMADKPCPIGPLPSLTGHAAIDTPDGPRLLRDIAVGDMVSVAHAPARKVIWAGHVTVPARGRFMPMIMRKPYLKLWDDLVVSRDQRVCLAGSEVEYLFGEERVSTAIRHLELRNSIALLKPAPTLITYHHIVLEEHGIMTVNGAAIESFEASCVRVSDALRKLSVLSDLALDRHVPATTTPAPILKGYEALTLTGVMVG